jgi:hypothetical protein
MHSLVSQPAAGVHAGAWQAGSASAAAISGSLRSQSWRMVEGPEGNASNLQQCQGSRGFFGGGGESMCVVGCVQRQLSGSGRGRAGMAAHRASCE